MLRKRLLPVAITLTLSAQALFAQNLQPVTLNTVILTIPLSNGEDPLRITLRQMMDIYKVPGFSTAVIEHSRIVWAKGFGVTVPGGKMPVTPGTLFQAAS